MIAIIWVRAPADPGRDGTRVYIDLTPLPRRFPARRRSPQVTVIQKS